MSLKNRYTLAGLATLLIIVALYYLYPYLLWQVVEWQKGFNLQLSQTLKNVQQAPQQAGLSLMLISFLYGIFHAVGPGHGKFILTSYLSFEQTKLPQAVKITLLSALLQGLVAVGLVSLLIGLLSLSRQHFNLTLSWVERGSYALMILFGGYWLWQAVLPLLQKNRLRRPLVIRQIRPASVVPRAPQPSAPHHAADCGCGHRHLPSATELDQLDDWRSRWLVIWSIGLRPCSGAILVLFLAYTLELYPWGVASALAMAIGTGLTLTAFAGLVLFAREKAVKTSRWYLAHATSQSLQRGLKIVLALVLILMGAILLQSSFMQTISPLFKR